MTAADPAPQAPRVDALAALGPLIELAAKGGAGIVAVVALAWQLYTTGTRIETRIDALDDRQATQLGVLMERVGALEQAVAVDRALREAERAEDRRGPAR